jgi:HAE1 family hydrophobic/amphiphilic exporter-1
MIVKPEYANIQVMQQVIEQLRQHTSGIPGVRAVFVTQAPLFRSRGQLIGGTNVEVDIKGADLDTVRRLAGRIEGQVRGLPGINFVRSSFEWGNPELQVQVDRKKAADLGLSVSDVGYMVETFVSGTQAGTFREQGKERDLILIGTARASLHTQALDGVVLYPPKGGPLRLSDIADIREAEGPTKIRQRERDGGRVEQTARENERRENNEVLGPLTGPERFQQARDGGPSLHLTCSSGRPLPQSRTCRTP